MSRDWKIWIAVVLILSVGSYFYFSSRDDAAAPAEDDRVADMPTIETNIEFDLKQGYGLKDPIVDCPTTLDWQPSKTFDCEVEDAGRPNRKADTIEVLMNEDGTYRWTPK